MLARRGEISTRELVRRSKAAKVQREAEQREAEERRRMQAAEQGSKTICDWLEEEKLWPAHGKDEEFSAGTVTDCTGRATRYSFPLAGPTVESTANPTVISAVIRILLLLLMPHVTKGIKHTYCT
jgi:hypothetical protein